MRGAKYPKRKLSSVVHGKRCGHHYCSDCHTRRGNNRGNRRFRHAIKTVLHRLDYREM